MMIIKTDEEEERNRREVVIVRVTYPSNTGIAHAQLSRQLADPESGS